MSRRKRTPSGAPSITTEELVKLIHKEGEPPPIDWEKVVEMCLKIAYEGARFTDIMDDPEQRPWNPGYDFILRRAYPEYPKMLHDAYGIRAHFNVDRAEGRVENAETNFQLSQAKELLQVAKWRAGLESQYYREAKRALYSKNDTDTRDATQRPVALIPAKGDKQEKPEVLDVQVD